MTLRHNGASSGFQVDAVTLPSIPGIGDTVLENSFTSPTGTAHAFNMPVTAFQFVSVPEPSVILLAALSGGAWAGWRRWWSKRQAQADASESGSRES